MINRLDPSSCANFWCFFAYCQVFYGHRMPLPSYPIIIIPQKIPPGKPTWSILLKDCSINRKKNERTGIRKFFFSFLPFGASVPGGSGRALITATTAAIYLGPRRTTNLSTAVFTPYLNFKGRFGLPLRNSIWFPGNVRTIQGDIRFLFYPQFTWGLGSGHQPEQKVLVNYKYIRFYQSALNRIRSYFFAGIGYHLDYHFNIKVEDSLVNLETYSAYPYGTGANSLSTGISLNLLYDTRNNSVNPLPGFYGNIIYRTNSRFLGSLL